MRNVLLLFITAILLSNCNDRQAVNNAIVTNNKDTVTKDTSLDRVNRIFNNPFRDINNFDISFGDNFIDSLHVSYVKKGRSAVTLTKDICIGDNCESWKTIVDKQENTVLYLFKGDGGEYGFSNDQYFLRGDSLVYVRNFSVSIETWPTDSTDTKWKIEEVVYHFQANQPYTRNRTGYTSTLDKFDFSLKDMAAKTSFDIATKLSREKSLELKKLLKMKDSENRE
ncbi:hypothetical protein A3860_32845 [Niastella vici]|uniref:Uncharacterized protein n=1 Tax=Niastella vici TaxID=1703345 RepID=A0A1V9FQH3_9BACT|nr:hypothetical protein [Niastella vici]OQP60604.1 hypothetical protein A3860_32845 [Niastella vici]